MQKTILFLCISIVYTSFAQETHIFQGKIVTDTGLIDAINIVNLTQETGTINTTSGHFEIAANPGDTLVFSSVHYAVKKYVITQDILDAEFFEVKLELSVNELEEVTLSQYSLSGKIEKDLQNIPTYTETLPLWNAAELKRMRVARPDDDQSPVENLVLNQNNSPSIKIDLEALIGAISKAIKSKRAQVIPIQKINDFYTEEFMITELKIPETEFYNFIDFINEQPGTVAVLRTNDALKVLDYLKVQSQLFKKEYKLD